MRILLDTNVLIASLISDGLCHELIEHCFLHHRLITSNFVLTELRDKLVEKFHYSHELANEAAELFSLSMEVVVPKTLDMTGSRDPDDDMVLATAKTGKCDCIITGDKDLLVLKEFDGIKIMTPRIFIDQEEN